MVVYNKVITGEFDDGLQGSPMQHDEDLLSFGRSPLQIVEALDSDLNRGGQRPRSVIVQTEHREDRATGRICARVADYKQMLT